jgi:Nucleotidyltransferase domain
MRVPPTADALRLRALAQRLVPHLAPSGRATVAITGSAARGDSGPGSDLDLWVLGPHSDRQHLVIARTPVTLLRQRPREALTLDTLCLYEVADLEVLSDPRGHFARVQRSAKRRALEVRDEVLAATWDGLRADLALVDDVSHWQQVLAWRQFAFRVAATWLYLRTGWRVPRLRTLHAHLGSKERRLFDAILGLPVAPAQVRAALKSLAPAYTAARKLSPSVPQVPAREISRRLKAREWAEALLLARRELRRELLPPLLTALDLRDVAELGTTRQGKTVLRAVQRCEGLTRKTTSGPVKRRVARLCRALELDKRFPLDVRRALENGGRQTFR